MQILLSNGVEMNPEEKITKAYDTVAVELLTGMFYTVEKMRNDEYAVMGESIQDGQSEYRTASDKADAYNAVLYMIRGLRKRFDV